MYLLIYNFKHELYWLYLLKGDAPGLVVEVLLSYEQ